MHLAHRGVIAGPENIGAHLLTLRFRQLSDLATAVRFGRKRARLAPLPQQLLDERTAHAKERGYFRLRSYLAIHGLYHARPQV